VVTQAIGTDAEAEARMRRQQRSDAGSTRLGPRDVQAIMRLEDMRAITEPDLAVLLGRLSNPPRGQLSPGAAGAVLARWRRQHLAQAKRIYVSTPPYVWLTAEGARLAGAGQWTEPGWSALPHAAAVSRTRLWLEGSPEPRFRVEAWLSERRFRAERVPLQRPGESVLVPDAEIVCGDGVTAAVEVELSPKSMSRTLAKVLRLTGPAYDRVIYVVPAESQTERVVKTAVLEAADRQMSSVLGVRPATEKILFASLPAAGLGPGL
jgi:hypothetical protein